jgi:hypothetical protein
MHVGTVTRVAAGYLYVRVPDLDPGREFGPLEPLAGVTIGTGQRVLVAQLGQQPGTLAVVRQLP